ncbi:MAG: helix-turn-helix transcriptional regulator [Selenomonadaceae bacterium]|nr:helix-turn-helix transcriptional regulator [Selenomonadaceae bacterium]
MNAQKVYVSNFWSLIRSRLDKNKPNIGDRIRVIREFVGLTQSELAGRMNLSRKTISKYENNFSSFKRVVSLKRFAEGLSANDYVVSPSDLLIDVQTI